MKILFINGSPNQNGTTAQLAKTMLGEYFYETLNLVDYKIYSYGQNFSDDQLTEVLKKIRNADVIVIGSPVYWHNLCGTIRTLLDRFYESVRQGELKGKRLYLLYQGASPEKWMLDAGEYTIKRFGKLYGLDYIGMANDRQQAEKLGDTLKGE